MLNRIKASLLTAMRTVVFSLAVGALSLNGSVIAQKGERKDGTGTKDAAAECVVFNYVLVHYMQRFGKPPYFAIRIVPDTASEHKIAETLAAKFTKLGISGSASVNTQERKNVLTIWSMKRTSPNTIMIKMSGKWGPRDGFGLSLVVERKEGSWNVSRVFGQSEI